MNTETKVLLGVLAGAAAGAFLGVLLAPEKGSVTRDKIARLGDDYADDITDRIRELRESIQERIDALRHEGADVVADKVQNEVKDLMGSDHLGSNWGSGKGSRSGGGFSSSPGGNSGFSGSGSSGSGSGSGSGGFTPGTI